MPDKRKMELWRCLYKMPLLSQLPGLILPVGITIFFTLIIDWSIRQFTVFTTYGMALTLLFSVLVFFIILWIQNLLLMFLFRGALHDFIIRTKERHLVTKRFGAAILEKFLTNGFKEDMLEGTNSLPAMLQKIEEEDGYPLTSPCYAILLDEAAEITPDRLLAVWDFDIMSIESVYDIDGKYITADDSYFNTLSRIYDKIPDEEDKQRVFVFTDEAHKDCVMSHKGWETLKTFHKKAGFRRVFYCFVETVNHIKNKGPHTAAHMDDFVYFHTTWLKRKYAWVIGRKRSSQTSLQHREPEVGDTLQMYTRLVASSTPIDLYD